MNTPGLHDNIDEATYHADPNSLSVSGAKTLLKAPALYKWQQANPVHRDVFDFGTVAHALVLGVGAHIEIFHGDSWRTKDAREFRDIQRAAGNTPILKADYDRAQAMADVIHSHKIASKLLTSGRPEVSAYAVDEPTGVLRRGRFDYLADGWIADYKTSADADPATFGTAAFKFGYHMQAAWYLDLARDCGADVEAFVFVVQAKEAPYPVSVCELDWASEEVGRSRNRRALDMYARCVETDTWPAYGEELHTISLPKWALNQEDFAS